MPLSQNEPAGALTKAKLLTVPADKRVESESQRTAERLALGLQVASVALAEVDYRSGTTHLTVDAARIFGLGQTELTVPRSAVHATFHPEDAPALREAIERSLDPDGSGWFSMDHRILLPAGETRWLRVRKQVYFEGEGEQRRPDHAVLAVVEVTAEKSSQEAIRESEERFRTLAESLPHLVWTADSQGKKTYCNQRYLDYAGATSLNEVDLRWSMLLHPEDQARVIASWLSSVATGEPYREQYRLRRIDGEYRHFLAQAVAVRDEAGRVVRWLGSATDVHDQKLTERALLLTEKLATAGRLAASVAHEINNPLSSVTNLLYLLGRQPSLDAEAQAYVSTAMEELARVSEITTQTLRFHKQSNAAAPTNLQDVVESVLALYGPRIRSCHIDTIRRYRANAEIVCLAGDVRQAVANVIGNAIDATPTGGRLLVRVRPSRSWSADTGPGIRITIADSGPGIPREQQGRIFDAFYTTKGLTNTGLGLWVTRGLIERCGGRISLRSSTAHGRSGTVFSLHIPDRPPTPKTS